MPNADILSRVESVNPLMYIPEQLNVILSTFFRRNPNLKSFHAIDETFLLFAQRFRIQLNESIFQISNHSREKTLQLLRKLSAEKTFETFYLIDDHSQNLLNFVDAIGTFENVAGISTYCIEVSNMAKVFPSLRLIRIPNKSLWHAEEMAQQFVHLEEIFIDCVCHIEFIIRSFKHHPIPNSPI